MRLPAAIAARIVSTAVAHVAEQERVVLRRLRREEGGRRLGVRVAAPDEYARRQLADPKLARERANVVRRARL